MISSPWLQSDVESARNREMLALVAVRSGSAPLAGR